MSKILWLRPKSYLLLGKCLLNVLTFLYAWLIIKFLLLVDIIRKMGVWQSVKKWLLAQRIKFTWFPVYSSDLHVIPYATLEISSYWNLVVPAWSLMKKKVITFNHKFKSCIHKFMTSKGSNGELLSTRLTIFWKDYNLVLNPWLWFQIRPI